MKKNLFYILTLALPLCLTGCGNKQKVTTSEPVLVGPVFNADSAMVFCNAQCEFGPRTMNSEAHQKCLQWIVDKFTGYGLDVEKQAADLTGWDNTVLHSTNIIAHFNTAAERKILICAHWDSRPWADNDPDSTNWHKPVLAANDGASGVAVMLELARILQNPDTIGPPSVGIDFVCFDAEDYGTPQWGGNVLHDTSNTWALGSQYFAKNLKQKYDYAILLDMVGGQGSHFYREGYSLGNAPQIVDKVWSRAADVGFSNYFVSDNGGYITDDHKPLIDAGVPAIDIVPYFPDCEQSSFGPTWHTVNDDIAHLDANVLKAVGQTLVQVIYSE